MGSAPCRRAKGRGITMRKVAVLMGGISSEREISLQTGQGVLSALNQAGYAAFPVDLTHNLMEFVSIMNREKPAVVFNALHGKYGEDGCVQGVLNLLQIPYTHSGVLASSIAMNKSMCKRIAKTLGIRVPKEYLVDRENILDGQTLPYPYVVKPNDEGSSVGVYIIRDQKQEKELLSRWPYKKPVLMESFIPGRELSVAVRDDGSLGIVEIISKDGFYDFTNKYTSGKAQHIIPAKIAKKDYQKMMDDAYLMHQTLGCRGVSRSDFRYDESQQDGEKCLFLELNTNPGMTPLSLVPEIAAHKNISYQELVIWLVERATCDK